MIKWSKNLLGSHPDQDLEGQIQKWGDHRPNQGLKGQIWKLEDNRPRGGYTKSGEVMEEGQAHLTMEAKTQD